MRWQVATLASLAVVAACRTAVDVGALERRGGVDAAAAELRFRVAAEPGDPGLWTALAAVERRRDRPGAALDALARAAALGAPFRAGLAGADRAALAALLVARAEARVARGSPGADADLAQARALGAKLDAGLVQAAALAAIAGDLAHADPERRIRGRARLATVDARRAAGFDPAASDDAVAVTAAWLDDRGARRAAHELLDRRAELAAGRGARPTWTGPTFERWLTLRRWWSGTDDPVDLPTLDHARALGASTCAYARGPRDPGCDVVAAAASDLADVRPWEPALVEAWQRDGVRVDDPDLAASWMIVAARATARGQLASWAHAVRLHVDLAAVGAAPATAAWVREAVALVELGAPPPPHLAQRQAPAGASGAWPDLVAVLAAADPTTIDDLREVAVAFAHDPALADRRAQDAADRAIDLAVTAPALGRAFAAVGDPARARAWWQRGFDASPEEPALALGLALAMVEAGDPPAALQLVTRAAAGSGDAAATFYRAARGFAAAGATLDAIGLARQAIEQGAPGDEDAAAGLAAALLAQLGRDRNAVAVAALTALPAAGDLSAVDAELARLRAADRPVALAGLQALAVSTDPAAVHLAVAALRAIARE